MVNLYEKILQTDIFPKVSATELLFSEYTCLQEETKFGIWSDCNYFAFVTSGKKTWKTIYNDYQANDGDILFIKKGANLTHQFFEDEFCAIFLFIPDSFIKAFLQTYSSHLTFPTLDISGQDAVLRIETNELLANYGKSIQAFFTLKEKPNAHLVRLKFEELLLSLFNDQNNLPLTNYFISLCQDKELQMTRVMEENFAYNLKLEDFAKLCGMSLSSFKTAFKSHYKTTPGAWLKDRKIELAKARLLSTDLPINQISFESGFEDPSHFIRVFKHKFEITPLQFRQQQSKKLV